MRQHTEYTEIKLTNIQGFRRICFLLLLGRGLKIEVNLASAGPMGCQLPHFVTHDTSFLHTYSSEDIVNFKWQSHMCYWFVCNILFLSNSLILQFSEININFDVTNYQLCTIIIAVYSLRQTRFDAYVHIVVCCTDNDSGTGK